MAYAFRTPNGTGTAGNASGGALSLTKPSGVADGDLLIVTAYLESDTNTWSSVPSGWNQDTTNLKIANTGAFHVQVFWKIAASEGASWSWTPATTPVWRILAIAAYTGATGSGVGRRDVSGGSQGDAQLTGNQTAPTVTTTANNDLVTFNYGNFGGADPGSTNTFCNNLRVTLGGCLVADAIKATAGATGTTNPIGLGSEDYAALHAAWFLDTGASAGDTQEWLPRQRAQSGPRTVNVGY